jgi:hypothetical protein
MLREALVTQFREGVPESCYDEIVEQVYQRKLAPWEAVKMLLNGHFE